MVVLDDLKDLTLYKKPFFLPIDENDKKHNSLIMLLTPNYQSSINAMNAPYLINRRYFESYYLERNIYRYISSKGNMPEFKMAVPANEEYKFNISESSLTSKERKKLPESDFGLPSQRRYPMPDENHVLLAIRFFNHVEEKYEAELAGNIIKKIKEFKMEQEVHVTEKNRFYPYWKKAFPNVVNESSMILESSLSSFKRVPLSKESIDKYKPVAKYLSHFRSGDDYKGYIWLDNDKVVAGCSVHISEQEIQAIEISKEYQRKGLSYKILDVCVKEFHADKLTVNKKNVLAINIYKKYGFSIYKETDSMYFMKLVSSEKEDSIQPLTEADVEDIKRKGKYYPIFIVNSFTYTNFGKLTKKVVPKLISEYSHSGMAFGPGLNNIYSYNANNNQNKGGGFNIESLKGYINVNEQSKISVNVFFVKASHYKLIRDYVRNLKNHVKDTKYNTSNLFKIMIGKLNNKNSGNMKMICSEFVYSVLKQIGADPLHKDLVTPDELNNLKDDIKIFNIFNGYAKDYNSNKTVDKLTGIIPIAKEITESEYNDYEDEYEYIDEAETANPVAYFQKNADASNIVYSGYEPDIVNAQQYINRDTVEAMFNKCSIKYPDDITISVVVSRYKDDYTYIDENTITVLAKRDFEKKFKGHYYKDYINFVIAIYAYHTYNPNVMDAIVYPMANFKSGGIDKELLNTNNHDIDTERMFYNIYRKYGDKALLDIVKKNNKDVILKYSKTIVLELLQAFTEAEDNTPKPEPEKSDTLSLDDIADTGKKIVRKIKNASVYKLNKIKRDIERGNTGTETRAVSSLERLKSGDIVQLPSPTIPGGESTQMESFDMTNEPSDSYIMDDNVIYFMEDSINYDTQLRDSLYADRIKNQKQIINIYKKVKQDCPFIRFAFTDINRYNKANMYFDLSYYNEAYFRNSINTDDKTMIKTLKIYTELIQRLIKDGRFGPYKKKTLFIPVLDWRHNKSMRMWMYREDLNPISIIYNLMKTNPQRLKDMFKGMDLVFMGPNNYFKMSFDRLDPKKDHIDIRFIGLIKRIIALGFTSVDPDPTDEPVNSAKGIALDIIDKVEKSQNIDIKSVKPIMTQSPDPVMDDGKSKTELEPAVKKIAADKTEDPVKKVKKEKVANDKKTQTVTTVTQKTSEDDLIKATKIDSNKNAVNVPDKDKQKEELVAMIAKAAADSSDTTAAIENLEDEEFKALLELLKSEEEGNVRVSNARAARIVELSNQFKDKEIQGKSVKDLLAQNPNDIELPVTKLNINTINKGWENMSFMNFDKAYDPDSDIVKMLDSMKNWSYPIGVRNIKVTDNTTSEDCLNLWEIQCEDYKGTRFKLKVDIPKFIDDKFLLLRGNKKTLMIQSTSMPIIKTDLDTCQIVGVGGYNKIFVRQYGAGVGKSMIHVDKLIKTLNKYDEKDITVVYGDNTRTCNKYELPIDYIDLASYYNRIETKDFTIYFSQDELRMNYEVDDSKGLPIGVYKNRSVDGKVADTIMYYDKQIAKEFNTVAIYITYMIMGTVDSKKFMDIYDSIIATGKRYMYSRASILSIKIPLVIVCAYVEGLSSTLKKAKIDYSFVKTIDKTIKIGNQVDYIKFSDGYLLYTTTYSSSMLMNGLKSCDTESYSLKEINSKEMYMDFLTNFGGSLKSDGLDNSYDCMIDPITREILELSNLPTDYVSVLLHANNLLADNKFIKHTNVSVRRLRRKELVAGYFYKALTTAYQSYASQIRHTRKNTKMTMKQSAVIDMILSRDPSSGDLSVNNCINDVEAANTVTSKGLVGMNTDRAYSLDKRGFDDTMLNVLGMSTGFSGNVGINRQATIDCNIQGSRGFIKPIDGNTDKFSTPKTLTITEALTPFGSTHDDPFRTMMTHIQTSKHMVRTTESDPLLVTNGADEAMPYLVSDMFAFKAKKDGIIKEIVNDPNNKNSYMLIEYKDGTHDFIDLSETIEKNSDGGYYVPLKLDTDMKVGQRVKADQVIAYDKMSFSNSLGESDNLAVNIGTLAKVAIMNTDEGYEDSAALTEEFARRLGTDVIVNIEKTIDKNANVFLMKKIGEQIMEGDTILSYQNAYDDEVANSILRNLALTQEEISELGRNPVISTHSGILTDIKIYRTVDLDELSPSLQALVKAYEDPIKKKKEIYKANGLDTSLLPVTKKMDNTGKTKNVYDGVKIEFYIKYTDNMAIGDKVVFYSANKGTIKYLIPEGQEPYSEFRPEEHIDAFVSISAINGRMVCSTQIYGSIAKLMVELDRSCKDLAGIPYNKNHI